MNSYTLLNSVYPLLVLCITTSIRHTYTYIELKLKRKNVLEFAGAYPKKINPKMKL